MKISMIVAMAHGGKIDKTQNAYPPGDSSRVIGVENAMPWHLPADFAWFRQNTLGKPVIMGRKTYESIGRPLPGRRNIVISRDSLLRIEGVDVVTTPVQALELVKDVDEVMIIGGGSIYESFLPLSTKLYLTFIEADISGDTRFPDWREGWTVVHNESYTADDRNEYDMRFVILERPESALG